MMHGSPIPYELTLFLTQLMVAFAIVVLAVAAKATRKQLDQRLRTLEVIALRTDARQSPTLPADPGAER